MPLTPEDRMVITDLINLHGHLVDAGDLDEGLSALFTKDIAYDVTDLGGGVLNGVAAFREASLALGADNPVAHHVTNIMITESDKNDEVHAVSKGFGVNTDGKVGSVTYMDTIVRTTAGWRISHREVRARRVPLTR